MDIMNQISVLIGHEKASAYKEGFTDGIKFVTEPSESLISAFQKSVDHKLHQIWDIYGKGKEYNVAKEAFDAILVDLQVAAHLKEPKTLQDFWNDEYGDDL